MVNVVGIVVGCSDTTDTSEFMVPFWRRMPRGDPRLLESFHNINFHRGTPFIMLRCEHSPTAVVMLVHVHYDLVRSDPRNNATISAPSNISGSLEGATTVGFGGGTLW